MILHGVKIIKWQGDTHGGEATALPLLHAAGVAHTSAKGAFAVEGRKSHCRRWGAGAEPGLSRRAECESVSRAQVWTADAGSAG